MTLYVNKHKNTAWYKDLKLVGGDGAGCSDWKKKHHLMQACKGNCYRLPCYLIRNKHAIASVV